MAFQGDSIFWVEVGKVVPNPFQPRREFDERKLQELGESIRMYGVLQPLTVTRQEVQNEDGTFFTQYELIAGERRLRASQLAGVAQVPVIIREGEDSEQEKLELAIIENLQREDLNAIDRALAFQQLANEFKMSHAQVAGKVGRSREYVANSIRLLQLPKHMQEALQRGELSEGHARTLLMLSDRPDEQETIFREVLLKKMSVRELERIARKIATDKVRKTHQSDLEPHLITIEKEFTETLGTRVQIQKTEFGGKLTIDYFSEDDLSALLQKVKDEGGVMGEGMAGATVGVSAVQPPAAPGMNASTAAPVPAPVPAQPPQPVAPAPVTQAAQPMTHTAPTPPAPEPVVTQPTPDPSLLQRLAAHTPLSFGNHEPQQPEVIAQPAPIPQSSFTPAPAPDNLVSGTADADMPATPPAVEEQPSDDDPDIYSLRNFTV